MDIKALGSSNLKQAAGHPAAAEESPKQSVAAAAPSEPSGPVDPAELEEAVAHLQDYVQNVNRSLQFEIDDSSGMVVVQVFAKDSGELIRQIPSEEALRLAEQLDDARTLLFEARA